MTLKEAGDIYNAQVKKLEEVKETIRIFHELLESDRKPFTTYIVRSDILQKAVSQLEEHEKHITNVLNKEMTFIQ